MAVGSQRKGRGVKGGGEGRSVAEGRRGSDGGGRERPIGKKVTGIWHLLSKQTLS